MGFQKRHVKFKRRRGVLITTAALNKISEEHEKSVFLFHTKQGFVVVTYCYVCLFAFLKCFVSIGLFIHPGMPFVWEIFGLGEFLYHLL